MRVAATLPVASRRASQLLRRHPQSLQAPSRPTRLVQVASPCWRASGLIGLETGPMIHRRSLPGHTAHHHAGRMWYPGVSRRIEAIVLVNAGAYPRANASM